MNSFPSRRDQFPDLRTTFRGMVKMHPVLSTCSKCLVAAAFAAVLASFGSPTMSVRAEDRSPVIDVRTSDPEMNAAIAQGRATLPKFWASYAAP